MMTPADRIVEATMPFTLRPKKNDRKKVIAAALEFLIDEYAYGMVETIRNDVVDVDTIKNLIQQLKEMETLEEPSTRHVRRDLDLL